jgi:hypothetical protein
VLVQDALERGCITTIDRTDRFSEALIEIE